MELSRLQEYVKASICPKLQKPELWETDEGRPRHKDGESEEHEISQEAAEVEALCRERHTNRITERYLEKGTLMVPQAQEHKESNSSGWIKAKREDGVVCE